MSDSLFRKKRHPIRIVARRCNLTRDLLRAWELRYRAVQPERTAGGQRLYSDADIERLQLISYALEAGRRIGQVAALPTAELARLVHEDRRSVAMATQDRAAPPEPLPEPFLEHCLASIEDFDPARLEAVLGRAAVVLHAPVLIDRLIAPLMIEIGERWSDGRFSPGHERLAVGAVRKTLDGVRAALQNPDGPGLVVATPINQRHEVGAMLAGVAAAAEGWRVIYLGPELPARSIAIAAQYTDARAVALSLIYPTDDPQLADELRTLRCLLPSDIAIIVGGRAAGSYRETFDEIGARWLPDEPVGPAAFGPVPATRRS